MMEEYTKFQPDRSISLYLAFESRKSSDSQKKNEKEFRVLIKHYFMKEKSPQESKEEES